MFECGLPFCGVDAERVNIITQDDRFNVSTKCKSWPKCFRTNSGLGMLSFVLWQDIFGMKFRPHYIRKFLSPKLNKLEEKFSEKKKKKKKYFFKNPQLSDLMIGC